MGRTTQTNNNNLEILSKTIKSMAFKKQQAIKVFEKGDEVEVASQELGYIGSYYTATIVSSMGPYHYRVKYNNLITDDKSDFLEEIVTASEVRPAPPAKLEECSFCVYDKVDAYDNDGWWIGYISKIIGSMYYVYFPTTGDEVAYPSQALRFHQEWCNGKWVSSKQDL